MAVVSHENPMETHMAIDDVEIFDTSKLQASNSIEELQKVEEKEEKPRVVNETEAISDKQEQNPFLSVLRKDGQSHA